MNRISSSEARALGLKRYFTGTPCKNGHLSDRQVSNGTCLECMRMKNAASYRHDLVASREKRRAYYEANREKILAINAASNARNRESVRAGNKEWYDRVKESPEWQARQKKIREENSAIKSEYDRKYRANRPEKCAGNSREWVRRNPEKRRIISFNYKAKRRAKERSGDSAYVVHAWAQSQKKVCYWCDESCESSYHIDHFVPLARGGEHRVGNLVISCPPCNLRKNARDPYEFASSIGKEISL